MVSDEGVLRRTRLLNGALAFPITVQLTRTFKQGHAHTPDAVSGSMANGDNARTHRSRDSAVSADPGRSVMNALANADRGKKDHGEAAAPTQAREEQRSAGQARAGGNCATHKAHKRV